MDTTILISLAIPVFFLMIGIELIYGYAVGNNNYRLNVYTIIELHAVNFLTILCRDKKFLLDYFMEKSSRTIINLESLIEERIILCWKN